MASRKRGLDSSEGDDGAMEDSNKRSRNPDGQAIHQGGGRNFHGDRDKQGPSLVLHVRSLPTFTTEQELAAMLAPYGQGMPAVIKALITQHNHQAFVQVSSLGVAEAIVRASAGPPGFHLRGRQVFLQYSNRKEVVVPPSNNQNQNQGQFGGAAGAAPSGQVSGQFHAPHGQESNTPNAVVLLTVTNLKASAAHGIGAAACLLACATACSCLLDVCVLPALTKRCR
jgi:hypothetical protein